MIQINANSPMAKYLKKMVKLLERELNDPCRTPFEVKEHKEKLVSIKQKLGMK